MTSIYDTHLDKTPANFVALSPVSFVERSAEVFGDLAAVIHGQRRYTWTQTRERAARLAAALRTFGVERGSTVSVMLPNTPEMVEAHYAVPALNAVLPQPAGRLQGPARDTLRAYPKDLDRQDSEVRVALIDEVRLRHRTRITS